MVDGDWYLFTLSDELGGIELGYDGLQDFVPDGRKNTLVVVETKRLYSKKLARELYLSFLLIIVFSPYPVFNILFFFSFFFLRVAVIHHTW